MDTTITRSTFLKGAAAGAASLATVGIAGPALAEETQAIWPENGSIIGITPEWLGEPPQIDEGDIVESIDTDILVVGCGTGGMFAVCAAAEAGANVIGIDRYPTGTGVRDGLGGIGSRYQKAWGTQIDKFDYIAMATQYAGGHVDQRLIRLFCDESGETIDWYGDRLAERNVPLLHEAGDDDTGARYHHYPTGHSPVWDDSDDGTGAVLDGNKVLYDYAVSKGARFDYSTQMVKLEQDEGGRVTGCIATNPDGDYVRYNAAKGVVVATGGYARNYDMMQAMQPWNLRILGRNGSMVGATGDGIKACLWAGAKMDETHSMMMFDRVALRPDQDPGIETMQSDDVLGFHLGSHPWLKVNADGERFFNESGTYEGILHADEYQKGHAHFTIFDSNWPTYCERSHMHGCSRVVPFINGGHNRTIEICETENQTLLDEGYMIAADTIEDLAAGLGLPADTLKATVDRYNGFCKTGVDLDFGKESYRLNPVDTPPFYGVKNTGRSLCTMDGIQIDANMNAIDPQGDPIPGLYVIGNDSGCYFANTYPNLSTGMACGRTITFGRHVGKYLASLE